MVDLDRVFRDFKDADPSSTGGRNPKISVQGNFLVEVEEVRLQDSEQFNATYFIVEFKMLESDNDKIHVGRSYSWVHDVLNKWFGQSNTKQFVAAVCGLDPTSDSAKAIDRDIVEEVIADDQPFTGRRVQLSTNPKKTKSGFDVCVHDWSPEEAD